MKAFEAIRAVAFLTYCRAFSVELIFGVEKRFSFWNFDVEPFRQSFGAAFERYFKSFFVHKLQFYWQRMERSFFGDEGNFMPDFLECRMGKYGVTDGVEGVFVVDGKGHGGDKI